VTLTLEEITVASRDRSARWHENGEPWLGVDWSNAMGGESGEAQNVVKKIRRVDTGVPGSKDAPRDELVVELGAELADVILYLVILADYYAIDISAAVIDKFNEVSIREGFPDRLPLIPPTTQEQT
jgi:NTP pyrophosphatase (non-canonical NTP hydrolase)